MPGSTLYATAADLREYLRADKQNVSADDEQFDLAIESACREIDGYCGRGFHQVVTSAESASARVYRPANALCARVDDFWSTTGLVVATDEGDDGTFETTWSASDYELEPLNGVRQGISGWPYWVVRAVGSYSFPPYNDRASVQITAKWGWETVPVPVKRATLVLAAGLLKTRDAPLGIAGMGDFGAVRIPINQYRMVQSALAPYRRSDRTMQVG